MKTYCYDRLLVPPPAPSRQTPPVLLFAYFVAVVVAQPEPEK